MAVLRKRVNFDKFVLLVDVRIKGENVAYASSTTVVANFCVEKIYFLS